jgi:hypothetical protein
MPQVPGPQTELEHLRNQVKEARSVYFQSFGQHKRMMEELGHSEIPFQDGSFAIAKARRAEATALSEYRRVLALYKNVLMGEKPPARSG